MLKVKDIAEAVEAFAPKALQESYDNAGLQVGDPQMEVSAILLCLDVTEEMLEEALQRHCNLIVSHHPLLFKGLKDVTGRNATQRIVIKAIRENVAIYSAHTNLDSAWEGVSHEIARILGLHNLRVMEPKNEKGDTGLGVIGDIKPTPVLEFLRRTKDSFKVKCLRYSSGSPKFVVRTVAVCGGAGASLISKAIEENADVMVTGDVKYHDFTTWGDDIVIADIGHFESELCACGLLSRIIREKYPDCVIYFSDLETNPVKYL